MPQQLRTQDLEPVLQAVDASRRALVFASDPGEEGSISTVANSLGVWTTGQLLAEVPARTAEDAPALRAMQGTILRAMLNALDREAAANRVRG